MPRTCRTAATRVNAAPAHKKDLKAHELRYIVHCNITLDSTGNIMDQLINEFAAEAQADNQDAAAPQVVEAAPKVKAERKPYTRKAAAPAVVEAVKKVNSRRVKTERKPYTRKAVNTAPAIETPNVAESAQSAAAAFQSKETTMQFDPANWMKSFTTLPAMQSLPTLPGAEGLQAFFTEAGSRGQHALERSRTVAEEVTAMARANMEALAETSRIAAAGAKSLGETLVERSREGLEQAAAEVKTLTDAQSPTEFFQRQSEIARASFDRAVADSSRFTETLVKLAGEAMQPLSSQAAVNAEKMNTIAA